MSNQGGALGLALFLASGLAFAQTFVAGVATVAAHIVGPLSAGETEPLEGELDAGTVSGEVEVDPSKRSSGHGLRPAAYSVSGMKDAAFALALPGRNECTLKALDASIPVKDFKVSVAGGPATATPGGLTMDARGTRQFKVGATMVLAANQPKAFYSGSYKVTMAYN